MAGLAFLPHGTDVEFNSVDVGGVVSVGIPAQSRGEVEITDADSGGDREFIPGLRDNGTVELECRLISDDAGQLALRSNLTTASLATSLVPVVLTLPTGANDDTSVTTYSFDAFVSALSTDLPQTEDTPATQTFTLRISGSVTLATV